jgi:hypothetical protein
MGHGKGERRWDFAIMRLAGKPFPGGYAMKKTARVVLLATSVAVGLPASAAWEELRRNDSQRLAIDTASIKRKGDEVSFRYMVDFREQQGDFKTAIYRSLTVKAAIRCKAQTISLRQTMVYAGNEAKGPANGVTNPTKEESAFRKIEADSSDQELYQRMCKAPANAAAKPPAKAPSKP